MPGRTDDSHLYTPGLGDGGGSSARSSSSPSSYSSASSSEPTRQSPQGPSTYQAQREQDREGSDPPDTEDSFVGLTRQRTRSSRSVTFREDAEADERMAHHPADHTRGESSADETTYIATRERVTRKRDYGTHDIDNRTGASNGNTTRARSPLSRLPRGKKRKTPRGDSDEQHGSRKADKGMWKKLAEKYGSVELENKGSVARDHLALERTFLAWLRTSLSFASIGIAITQLFRLNTSISSPSDNGFTHLRQVGKPLGATFIGLSIVILFIGFHRFFESQHYVIRGKFPASRGSIMLVAFIAAALIIASLVVVLAIKPNAFEKK